MRPENIFNLFLFDYQVLTFKGYVQKINQLQILIFAYYGLYKGEAY
jgi:hypothetical protein